MLAHSLTNPRWSLQSWGGRVHRVPWWVPMRPRIKRRRGNPVQGAVDGIPLILLDNCEWRWIRCGQWWDCPAMVAESVSLANSRQYSQGLRLAPDSMIEPPVLNNRLSFSFDMLDSDHVRTNSLFFAWSGWSLKQSRCFNCKKLVAEKGCVSQLCCWQCLFLVSGHLVMFYHDQTDKTKSWYFERHPGNQPDS